MVDLSFWIQLGVLSGCSLGVAFVGTWLFSAVLRRRATSLEYAVAELQTQVIREVKRRAGDTRASKSDTILAELEQLKAAGSAVPRAVGRRDFAGDLIAKRSQQQNGA